MLKKFLLQNKNEFRTMIKGAMLGSDENMKKIIFFEQLKENLVNKNQPLKSLKL